MTILVLAASGLKCLGQQRKVSFKTQHYQSDNIVNSWCLIKMRPFFFIRKNCYPSPFSHHCLWLNFHFSSEQRGVWREIKGFFRGILFYGNRVLRIFIGGSALIICLKKIHYIPLSWEYLNLLTLQVSIHCFPAANTQSRRETSS